MKYFAALLSLLLMPMAVLAEELMVVTEEFPPYNYQDHGIAKGLSTEMVQAVLGEAGLSAEFNFMPWARAYKTAEIRKNTLIFSIARIPEREDSFIWVGEIAPYRTSLYKLREADHIQISSLEEAARHRVGVSIEDVIYTYLKRVGFEQLELVGSDTGNIRKLAGKRIDVIAYDEASFGHVVGELGLDIKKFERALRLDELSGSLYMALNQQSDADLAERLRDALVRVHEKGIYDEIQSRYLLLN